MKRISLAIFATLLMASYTFAGTTAQGTNAVSPTLKVNANLVQVVQLTLSQGVSASACAVSAGGGADYSMDFGTVDGLGISNGSCGQKFAPAAPGAHAIYYTDYQLTPAWASQPSAANPTITAWVSTNFLQPNIALVAANVAGAPVATDFSALSTNNVAQTAIANAVSNGTALTRWIGVDVNPSTTGANVTGAASAIVTFTLTVN